MTREENGLNEEIPDPHSLSSEEIELINKCRHLTPAGRELINEIKKMIIVYGAYKG